MGNPDLAAAVASRICHDLVSPVGAIVNGVDLLRDTGPADMPDTVGMIAQSAGRASALLQFYRIAFGAAGDDAQPVGRAALRELASVLAQPPRVLMEWHHCDGPPMARAEARLLGLLTLAARSVTGMRGVICIRPGRAAVFPLAVSAEAEAFANTAPMLELPAGAPAGTPSPRSVEFVLAREAAGELGVPLRVDRAAGRITIGAGVEARVQEQAGVRTGAR